GSDETPLRLRSGTPSGMPSGDGRHRALGARHVVVGDDPALEEVAFRGDARGSVTDSTGADHEDSHGAQATCLLRRLEMSWPVITTTRASRNITVPMT